MPSVSESHTRRLSSESSITDDESPDLPDSSLDSSAALILLHDSEGSSVPFDFTDDDDSDRDESSNLVSPVFDMRKSTVFPPLRPSLVFLYLLAPYLKLGALDLINSRLPLKYGLLALFTSALASIYSRQIWHRLARYLRKADITEVVLDTFARRRSKERLRMVLRGSVKAGNGILSILVAVTYLRYAMYQLQPLFPRNLQPVVTYVIVILLVAPILGYLSYAKSLQSKRIIYATSLSITTYVLWISVIIYSYKHGSLEIHTSWLGTGSFWPGIVTIAFSFCTSSTLSLYTSLKLTALPVSTTKTPRSHSFRFLSILSAIVAVVFLLPSVLMTMSSQPPSTFSLYTFMQDIPPNDVVHLTTAIRLPKLPSILLPLPSDVSLLLMEFQTILSFLTLMLGIPSVIVTTPPALPRFPSAKFNVSRVFTIFLVLLLALIPPRSFSDLATSDHSYLASSGVSAVLTAILVVTALLSTYFLPALVHISTHFFKKPLTIVIPRKPVQQHSLASDLASAVDNNVHGIGSGLRQMDAVHDELLLRKERALQKKQFRKRIVWDIAVWTLLLTSMALVVFTICGFVGMWQP